MYYLPPATTVPCRLLCCWQPATAQAVSTASATVPSRGKISRMRSEEVTSPSSAHFVPEKRGPARPATTSNPAVMSSAASKDLVGPTPIASRPGTACDSGESGMHPGDTVPPRPRPTASAGFSQWQIAGTKFEVDNKYRLIRSIGTGVRAALLPERACRPSPTLCSCAHASSSRPPLPDRHMA